MSAETIEFHYGKHVNTYLSNLNKLIAGTPMERMNLEQIVIESEGPTYNNAAQVWNHYYFFQTLSPHPQTMPHGELLASIEYTWGSFDNFRKEFDDAALSLFGSGWVWLVKDSDGRLSILKEANAGNPIRNGLIPLLTCDVWEHAYYIDYRNRRADYMKAFWKLIDWKIVEERFNQNL